MSVGPFIEEHGRVLATCLGAEILAGLGVIEEQGVRREEIIRGVVLVRPRSLYWHRRHYF